MAACIESLRHSWGLFLPRRCGTRTPDLQPFILRWLSMHVQFLNLSFVLTAIVRSPLLRIQPAVHLASQPPVCGRTQIEETFVLNPYPASLYALWVQPLSTFIHSSIYNLHFKSFNSPAIGQRLHPLLNKHDVVCTHYYIAACFDHKWSRSTPYTQPDKHYPTFHSENTNMVRPVRRLDGFHCIVQTQCPGNCNHWLKLFSV